MAAGQLALYFFPGALRRNQAKGRGHSHLKTSPGRNHLNEQDEYNGLGALLFISKGVESFPIVSARNGKKEERLTSGLAQSPPFWQAQLSLPHNPFFFLLSCFPKPSCCVSVPLPGTQAHLNLGAQENPGNLQQPQPQSNHNSDKVQFTGAANTP